MNLYITRRFNNAVFNRTLDIYFPAGVNIESGSNVTPDNYIPFILDNTRMVIDISINDVDRLDIDLVF